MNRRDLILTYDIGTTGIKCTIFDEMGRQVSSQVVAYQTYYPKPGWSEQDPDDFWKGAIEGTRLMLEKEPSLFSRIAVIGLSGHMNGCIPVDRFGEPLFRDIIHSDCRCGKETEQIHRVFDEKEFFNIAGNRIDPHYTLSKILWLKNHYLDLYKQTAFFINSKDYVSYKLTGTLGITDFSDASLTCMLDMKKKDWSQEIISRLNLDRSKLPQLLKSYDIAGYVTKKAAGILGLREGIPVVAGGGDGACATRGSGTTGNGDAYNYIGSSSWICTLHDQPVLDDRIFNYYDLDGVHCNVCGTIQCATISYDWVVENIGRFNEGQLGKEPMDVHQQMEQLARQSIPGSNGIFFLPYLMGERTPYWDANTKGAFIGFTLFHKRSDILRSVYEGVAYALRSVLGVFEENQLSIEHLTLIGGGAKSRLWNEIMSDVYGKKLRIHRDPGEATSLGSAMAAGVGVCIFTDFESAARIVQYDQIVEPDPARMIQYDRFYEVYKMMYPALKPVYDRIAGLQDY